MPLLYWAKDNLIYEDYQDYWEGANRKNIDTMIKEECKVAIAKFEAER